MSVRCTLLYNAHDRTEQQGFFCETCPSETVTGRIFNDIRLDVSDLMGFCCEACLGEKSSGSFRDACMGSCCEAYPVDKSLGSCRKVCPSRMVSDSISILITSSVEIVSTSGGVLSARVVTICRRAILLFNILFFSTLFVVDDLSDLFNHLLIAPRSYV